MRQEIRWMNVVGRAALLGGLLVVGGLGFGQAQIKAAGAPDSQIESNVLKALAGAPELANQNITTTTVFGTVTLSGSVSSESSRVLAETLASKSAGVQKVVDELTINSDSAADANPAQDGSSEATGTNPNLQSDGTMASGSAPQQEPQSAPSPASPNQPGQPDVAGQPGQQPAYGPPYRRPYSRGPYGPPPSAYSHNDAPYGGQQAGQPVVVPSGAMLRVRINQGLDSKHSQPGTTFDGVVVNDVAGDGAIAIPRGATVQGAVVDAQSPGSLSGRGELLLKLTQVTLAGKTYPLVTDMWSRTGANKTGQTVGNAVGLGAMGALIGAVAGGGPGALIGAGVGGTVGLGASAASGGGQALVPPEAILTFHLTKQAALTTVSQAEMERLGYSVPVGAQQRLQRRPPPPPYYYGPYPYRGYYPYPY